VYIGDSLHAPYGNKSKEELLAHTKELLTFLQKKKVDIFVSACNSLSTLDVVPILNELRIPEEKYFDMTMFAKASLVDIATDKNFLIYATEATIKSGMYQAIFSSNSPYVLASKNLARAIEERHTIEIDEEIDVLVDYVLEHNIKQVFLGCTHYPLIGEYLEKRFYGIGVTFINPAIYTKKILSEVKGGKMKVTLFFTKDTPYSQELGEELFQQKTELVSL
jgi:glutamate racemase